MWLAFLNIRKFLRISKYIKNAPLWMRTLYGILEYMGKRENDEYELNKKSPHKLIMVFVTAFVGFLVIGIVALGLVGLRNRNNESPGESPNATGNLNDNNSIFSKWEVIPEGSTASSDNLVTEAESEGIDIWAEVAEEDAEYTHILNTAGADEITIGFAGDILFDTNYAVGNAFKNHGNSPVGVVGDSLLERMKAMDIMMINNEFPYSDRGTATEGKTFTFRARPETVSILNEMGVDIVGLANNHAYDYGENALLDTFDTLDGAGIEYVGAGHDIDEASHAVYYITESGMKLAFICATQIERLSNPDTKEATSTSAGVFRCLDDTLLLERIREAKEKDAFVIVFIHWGTEGTSEIDYLQIDQAAEIAQAGADLIIGAHPHVLQKIDYVSGVPVVYSLGNYIFNSKTMDTCLMQATISKDGDVSLLMIPASQSGCTVTEATGSEAQRIINEMLAMSPNINIDTNGNITSK